MSPSHPKTRGPGRRPVAIVLLAVLFLLAVFVVSTVFSPARRPSQTLAGDELLQIGQQVYEAHCAACHGLAGEGHVVAGAPALDGSEHAWHHPDGQIQQIITSGGMQMPALGHRLTAAEVEAVIRYIQSWWSPDQLAFQQGLSRQFPLR